MTKFDPKFFQGKEVLRKVRGEAFISQLFVWDKKMGRYESPLHRKCYRLKRRIRDAFGAKKDLTKWFQSLEEARAFSQSPESTAPWCQTQSSHHSAMDMHTFDGVERGSDGRAPTLGEIRDHWLMVVGSTLTENSLVNHNRYWRCHLSKLSDLPVRGITPRVVDEWIQWMKSELPFKTQGRARKAFLHELKALSALLTHYDEYWDDLEFKHPVKKRHRQAVVVQRHGKEAQKDLTLEEFQKFSNELRRGSGGVLLWALAQVQFFHCLRISEVAGLKWEDIDLRISNPSESSLIVRRHVIYHRGVNKKPFLAPGFKNSSAQHPTKGSHLTPESYSALREIWCVGASGLVFEQDGEILKERFIVSRFNRAFKRAGLPYTGTHILRHGGTRYVLNSTGDLSIAQQALGNRDMKSTLVYAQRDKQALNGLFKQRWREHEKALTYQSEVVGGREWEVTTKKPN